MIAKIEHLNSRLDRLDTSSATATDSQMRKELFCRGCGEKTEFGVPVCWTCFKGGQDGFAGNGIPSAKYSPLDWADWLTMLDHEHPATLLIAEEREAVK